MNLRCTNFRPLSKNTLKGFVDLEFTDIGIIVKECPWHEKNGREWLAFPGRSYTDKNTGDLKWVNMIDFANADARQAFQDAALKAVYQHLGTAKPPNDDSDAPLFA